MSVGQIREFSVKSGNWSSYIERLESYFLANKIADDVKLPTLIAVMGEEAYELLATLASPTKPASLTYATAVRYLQNHLQPKPSILAERYRFRQRRQMTGESIAEYVAELKKMSRYCEFNSNLEENLKDQFVCGIRSELTRQRLFAEDDITYKKAVSLALSLEAAEKDASAVERFGDENNKDLAAGLHKMNINGCYTCGDSRHSANNCFYKDYKCSYCQEKGHLRRMCQKMRRPYEDYDARRGETAGTASEFYRPSRGGRVNRGGRASRGGVGRGFAGRGRRGAWNDRERAQLHLLDDDGAVAAQAQNVGGDVGYDSPSGDEEEPMYQMSLSKYRPVCVSLKVQNCLLNMEVDTGSALSCVSKAVYEEMFRDLELKSCRLTLKFYDGSIVRPLGYVCPEVSYNGNKKNLDLYVVDKGTTCLLGRQWLSELKIPVIIPSTTQDSYEVNNCIQNKDKTLNDIISRHRSLFDGTLGRYTGGEAELCVREGTVPIYCRARPLPYALRARVDSEIDAMLRAGVIEPVDQSDWATPLVIVNKADGGLRLCADYKVTLNRVLKVDRYPVPKVDDLFSGLSGNQYFSKLDLSQAYNQVVLSEKSKEYTVINTHRGLFKYNRLVYGLASSPAIFQKLMENTLKHHPDVVVFFDDILIKSRDLESHLKAINDVFITLERNGLKIKKSKCEFLANEVRYLGFIIDRHGVRVDPDKIKPIVTMPHPTTVTELKSFLGMVNFYGRFINNLSSHLNPLYILLRKGKHWYWGAEQNSAFEQVKRLLSEACALAHFDMALETVVTVDASAGGLGAVLAQRGPAGGEHVVAYASRTLTQAEKHYSQIHKEALAIVFAVDKFHQYVYGRSFTLRTDHKPLVSIFGPNIGIPSAAASRLQRWAVKLSAYDFKIEYVRTDMNTADVLSRLIRSHKNEFKNEEEHMPEQTYLHFSSDALLLDSITIKKETRSDPILGRVLSYIKDGWPTDVEIRELTPYLNRKQELYCELGCIMWGHRVVIPPACREKVLTELHDSHMGIVKTKSLARSYVWWPGVDEAVERVCRACAVCAALADAPPSHEPRSWPWPSRPWSRLHLDFLSHAGMTYLIIIDACSKWIEAIKMTRTTAQAVITVLREIWARFGLPKQVVSDNGPPFSSSEFSEFLAGNGIEQIFSAPYHPASNGAAENAVKICKRAIKKALKQGVEVHTALCRFLLAYRNTEHATTGDSPANILQGRSLRMRLDCLKPEREARVAARQASSESAAGGACRQFAEGDEVWYRDYRGTDRWLAGRIQASLGSTDYTVRATLGTEVHRHVDQLRRRVTQDLGGGERKSSSLVGANNRQSRRSSLLFPVAGGEATEDNNNSPVSSPESARYASPTVQSPAHSSSQGPLGTFPPLTSVPSPVVPTNNEPFRIPERRYPLRNRKRPIRFGFDEID